MTLFICGTGTNLINRNKEYKSGYRGCGGEVEKKIGRDRSRSTKLQLERIRISGLLHSRETIVNNILLISQNH